MSIVDTLKKYILPALIVVLILLLMAGYFLVWPKYQEYKTVKKEFDLKDEEIKTKEEYLPKLETISKRLEEASERVNIVDSALPTEPSIASLYNYFKKTTSENGLILNQISVTSLYNPIGDGSNSEEMLFSASVIGSYDSVKLFLAELYLSARIIEVKSIGISSSEGGELASGSEAPTITGNNLIFDLKIKTQSYDDLTPMLSI